MGISQRAVAGNGRRVMNDLRAGLAEAMAEQSEDDEVSEQDG